MGKIIISAQDIENANNYVPLEKKEEWVSINATKCFDKLAITADGEDMPPMYMVNVGIKNRYLMAALAGMYLKKQFNSDVKDDALMDIDAYDEWAGSHIFCQIDRLKAVKEARDKCYELLYDYHELEKMLSAQIHGLLEVQNDQVMRMGEYTSTQLKDLPSVIEQLKAVQQAREEDNG